MGTVQTKHGAIFDYWKNKAINKQGCVFTIDDSLASDVLAIVEDWKEPKCWGCGKHIEDEKTEESHAFDNEYSIIWESAKGRKRLQRCHIVPDACGGEDSPENLFLLCPECHKQSPDTVNRSAFLRWVYNRRKLYDFGFPIMREFLSMIELEITERGGVSLQEMLDAIEKSGIDREVISYSAFYNYCKGRITSHANKLSESTLVVAYADFITYVFDSI